MANPTVRARLEPKLKSEAEAVLASVGLTVSDAFRLLMVRVVHDQKLPFEPYVPNRETIAAMEEARAGRTTKAGRTHASVLAALNDD